MKNVNLFIIFFLFTFLNASATEQVPDILIYQNQTLQLSAGWGHPSPVQTYFSQNDMPYPFTMLSTANYRGHVAIWEIKGVRLFLNEISINKESYKQGAYHIESQITKYNKAGAVFADWFSGVLVCASKPAYYFYIRYGEVIDVQVIRKKDYRKIENITVKDTTNKKLMGKYAMLRLNHQYISYYFRLYEQDSVVLNNVGGFFYGSSGFSPLLECYANDHMKWPYNWENFEKSGAPNCTWAIRGDRVFLEQVRLFSGTGFYAIDTDTVPLKAIFSTGMQDNQVFAYWLNGIYTIRYVKENPEKFAYDEFITTGYTCLRVADGIITEKYNLPGDFDFENVPPETEPGLHKMLEVL